MQGSERSRCALMPGAGPSPCTLKQGRFVSSRFFRRCYIWLGRSAQLRRLLPAQFELYYRVAFVRLASPHLAALVPAGSWLHRLPFLAGVLPFLAGVGNRLPLCSIAWPTLWCSAIQTMPRAELRLQRPVGEPGRVWG